MADVMLVNGQIPEATPESQGLHSESVINFIENVRKKNREIHSVNVIKNGKLVFQAAAKPYTLNSQHKMNSASKTLVLLGMLLAIQDGYCKLDDPVIKYMREYFPENYDEKYERLTIYDMLSMNTGHGTDTFAKMRESSENWNKTFFSQPLDYEPGHHPMYNNGVPHVLGCLVKNITGKKVQEIIYPRVLNKLGIDVHMYDNEDGELDSSLSTMTISDFAKYALFFYQEGSWEGEQLVDKDLMHLAAQRQNTLILRNESNIKNWQSGYCFQMWKNRYGGFRIDGGAGQIGIIIPETNLIISITGNNGTLDDVIDEAFAQFHFTQSATAYDEDPEAYRYMKKYLADWSLAPSGLSSGSWKEKEYEREYSFDPNPLGMEKLSFAFSNQEVQLNAEVNGVQKQFIVGLDGDWRSNSDKLFTTVETHFRFNAHTGVDDKVFSMTGGFTDNETLIIATRNTGWMPGFTAKLDFRFGELKITLSAGSVVKNAETVLRGR